MGVEQEQFTLPEYANNYSVAVSSCTVTVTYLPGPGDVYNFTRSKTYPDHPTALQIASQVLATIKKHPDRHGDVRRLVDEILHIPEIQSPYL